MESPEQRLYCLLSTDFTNFSGVFIVGIEQANVCWITFNTSIHYFNGMIQMCNFYFHSYFNSRPIRFNVDKYLFKIAMKAL